MNIDDCRQRFLDGGIDKHQYIREMYDAHHSDLFDYAGFIGTTDIEKIEIVSNDVVFTSRRYGIKMFGLRGDHRIAPVEILNFGEYELDETLMMLNLMPKEARIMDIGANAGWFSFVFSGHDPSAKIYSFEPIPSTFDLLVRNIGLNGSNNICASNFGFSNIEQELEFFYNQDGSGNASLKNTVESESPQKVKALVKRMDDVVPDLVGAVDFIKCDVEGAELLVFEGGLSVLASSRPIVFSEILRKWSAKYEYHPNDILALFFGLGYQCFVVEGSRLKQLSTVDDSTVETNYFFLHSEKHADIVNLFVVGK